MQQLENIGLHGAVKHQLAFLLGGFDQLRVLGESRGCSTEQNQSAIVLSGIDLLLPTNTRSVHFESRVRDNVSVLM